MAAQAHDQDDEARRSSRERIQDPAQRLKLKFKAFMAFPFSGAATDRLHTTISIFVHLSEFMCAFESKHRLECFAPIYYSFNVSAFDCRIRTRLCDENE